MADELSAQVVDAIARLTGRQLKLAPGHCIVLMNVGQKDEVQLVKGYFTGHPTMNVSSSGRDGRTTLEMELVVIDREIL